jgi:adenylate cyclase
MGTNAHAAFACWKRDVPEDRRRIARRVLGHLRVFIPLANWAGALIVFAYFAWAFPPVKDQQAFGTTGVNAIVGLIYLVLVSAYSTWKAERYERVLRRWRRDDSPPTDQDRREILYIPAEMVKLSAQNWLAAIPVFFLVNLDYSLELACDVAVAIFLAGLTSCASVYLVAERLTRPALAYVLDPQSAQGERSLSVGPRIILTWALLSAVPLIGIITIPLGRLPDNPADLAAPIVFVAGCALVVGLLGMKAVAQNIARPIRTLRDALERVGEGDIDFDVTVDDASEIGRLQAGFNQMLEGLRERRRIRELFGQQVGDDVAQEALERGVTLGGEQRTVAALFIDIVGSTALAGRERPERVVELLNGFFQTVVDVVGEHGGLINKFEGDGALCVFGAPTERDDYAASALSAARELSDRLADSSALDAAIGVSCGVAVAGNVGAEQRYEYTVIGDPVNEASRLCELAKNRPGRILASSVTVEHAGEPEARHWEIDGEVRLRGRSTPTRLAFPVDLVAQAADSDEQTAAA